MSEEYQKRKHPLEQVAIARAVSLKEAVSYNVGKNVSPLEILGVAEVFSKWLNEGSQKGPTLTKVAPTGPGVKYPVPTLEQKAVIDEIVKRSGRLFDDVCAITLNWAKETHNEWKYPEKMSSVESFLKWSGWEK